MQMIQYIRLVIFPASEVYTIQQCLLFRRRRAWVLVLITLAYRTSHFASIRAINTYKVHEAVNDLIYPNSRFALACTRMQPIQLAIWMRWYQTQLLSCLRD